MKHNLIPAFLMLLAATMVLAGCADEQAGEAYSKFRSKTTRSFAAPPPPPEECESYVKFTCHPTDGKKMVKETVNSRCDRQTTSVSCDTDCLSDGCFRQAYGGSSPTAPGSMVMGSQPTESSCTGNSGEICDSISGSRTSMDGVCASATCDTDEVCSEGSDHRKDCKLCHPGYRCDSNVDTKGYRIDGICVWDEGGQEESNYDCDTNEVCDDTGRRDYRSDCLLCDAGDACDSDINNDGFVADGVCTADGRCDTTAGDTPARSVANGMDCAKGQECESGYCIEGKCRTRCTSEYKAKKCSDDDKGYNVFGGGICVINDEEVWQCDSDEVALERGNYYADCAYAVQPNRPAQCDDAPANGFYATGLCARGSGTTDTKANTNCDTDEVCQAGGHMRSSCQYCPDGSICMKNAGRDGFIPDGICRQGSCVS